MLFRSIITILLLLAVIGYFAVQGYNYFVSPETTTLVYRYHSERSIALRGYVVRDEQVVDCNETLIELKHAEGERVGQGDTIASVYRSADALNATQQLETLRAQKEQLEYAKSASSDAATALRLDTDIREQIISVRAAYESGAYSSLDTLIPQLKTTVLKREYAYNGSDDLTAKLDELNAQITALSGAASGGTTRITAPVSGTYSAVADGYESVLTPEALETMTPSQLSSAAPQSVSTTVGKLIQGSAWYFAANVNEENAAYSAQADQLEQLPWVYLGLFLMALALMLVLLDLLSRAVVRPLLALARASRSIADNDFSGQDLPVHSQDEVGRLTGTFNQMKHAMQEHLATLNALHREEVRNLALEKDLDHTRMEMLKSQVNPHFLFNTLNMISCMARLEDAETTDKMIVSLGNLFRHNLRTKQQEVTLEEELDGLEDYIYLQQMRFDGRITVEKQILVDPARARLPSFTLQPVIENAFSHGLKACEEGGRILLRVWRQGRMLYVTVADNGKGMTEEELAALSEKMRQSEQTGKSIGLGNIFRRVSMLYPDTGKMQVFSRAGHGTVIRFEIPQGEEEERA